MALKLKFSHQFIIIWLSVSAFLHNILMNGANNVIISSLQKEFYLSSRETGIYVSVYDIGSLVSSVVISFAAARGSKPRWISFGMIMLFIGCMVNVLPHFLKPQAGDEFNSAAGSAGESIELCNKTLKANDNLNGTSTTSVARNYTDIMSESGYSSKMQTASTGFTFQLKYLLYAANIINGLSSASMTTITFSYIEDIAPHSLSAIYESIYYATGAFGVSFFC
jgi:MFS family permease